MSKSNHLIKYDYHENEVIKTCANRGAVNQELRRLGQRGVGSVKVFVDTTWSDLALCHTPYIVYEGHPEDIRELMRNPFKGL